MAGLSHEIAGNPRLLLIKRQDLANWASRIFPCFLGSPPAAHQLGLHFGKIDCAANRASQQVGSQFLRSWLTVNDGKNGGCIEHNAIHLCLFKLRGRAAFRQQFIDQ